MTAQKSCRYASKAREYQQRDHMTVLSIHLFHKNVCFASHPYIEECLAYYRKRLVFRLSSTPKRLLGQIPNGVYA